MPYIVARKNGSWEARESRATGAGPRSRTLASFRVLTPEAIDLASTRASKPLEPDQLRAAAVRAGAPIAKPAAERAARDLLGELTSGKAPRPVLRRLLVDALGGAGDGVSDSARSAASWIAASPAERGEALRDLLLLADRLPARRRPAGRFPRIESTPR